MRMTKIICVVLCALSVFGIVRNGVILRSALANGASTSHALLGISASSALAIFWAYALYGISRKAPIIWKLGWIVIIGAYLIFTVRASQSILKVQEPTDRWIQLLFIVIGAGAITGFWCYFWAKQKGHFVPRPSQQSNR